MHRLVLRWTLWSSLLVVIGVTGSGALRFLTPPDRFVPTESLRQYTRHAYTDEPAMWRIAPEEEAARAGFPVQWPMSLPPEAVLRGSTVPGGRVTFLWSRGGLWNESVVLRVDQDVASRQLPDRPEVTVHGLPGRAGRVACLDRNFMNGEAFERDCLGIWWIENGVNVVLTSPALNARQLLQIAESLRPLDVARPIPFMSRTVRQAGGRRVRAGNVAEHPIPSVTYLSNLDAYLDRTAAGFIALAGEDPDRRRPIAWNVQRQSFQSVTCGRVYSWLGRCVQGPCRDGLERLDVSIDGDEVIVDARARFIDANRPLEFHSILSRGPAWP